MTFPQSMCRFVECAQIGLVVLAVGVWNPYCLASDLPWSGTGNYRMLVTVEAVDLSRRSSDEMVAAVAIDFQKLLSDQDIVGEVDLSSLQVHRLDAASRKPDRFVPFRHGSRGRARRARGFEPATFGSGVLWLHYARLRRATFGAEKRGPAASQT